MAHFHCGLVGHPFNHLGAFVYFNGGLVEFVSGAEAWSGRKTASRQRGGLPVRDVDCNSNCLCGLGLVDRSCMFNFSFLIL